VMSPTVEFCRESSRVESFWTMTSSYFFTPWMTEIPLVTA